MTLTGAIQEGKLGETGQRTDKTGDNKQEEDKKEKKTTLGTPVSQSREEEETTKKENYTGYPRSSQTTNKVQNWYVQQAQAMQN